MKQQIKESLDAYALKGRPTGSFLEAVLENDLMEAVGRADSDNRKDLHEICSYVFNHIPSVCWGSEIIRLEWLQQKRWGLTSKDGQ